MSYSVHKGRRVYMRGSEVSIVVAEEAREPEERLISITRILLTIFGQMFVLTLDQPRQYGVAAALALYSFYAIWLHLGIRRHEPRTLAFNAHTHWVDMAWCMLLIWMAA